MIHTAKNCIGFLIVDAFDTPIPYVKSFNDETFEIEVYLYNTRLGVAVQNEFNVSKDGMERDLCTFKGIVKGAKLKKIEK